MYGSIDGIKQKVKEDSKTFCCFAVSPCTGLFLSFMVIIIAVAFNAACISVGLHYADMPCYASHALMPLNKWLVIICTYILVFTAYCLVQALLLIWTINKSHGNEDRCFRFMGCTFMIITVLYAIGWLILVIIGIVELAYQFEPCKDEAKIVSILSIVCVIISCFQLSSYCSCTNKSE